MISGNLSSANYIVVFEVVNVAPFHEWQNLIEEAPVLIWCCGWRTILVNRTVKIKPFYSAIRINLECVFTKLSCQRYLTHVVHTACTASCLADRLHSWQEHANQYSNDGYDHQQFNERKCFATHTNVHLIF